MQNSNENNLIDDFRPPNRPNPQPRRDLNYRQTVRPVYRTNFNRDSVNQPPPPLPAQHIPQTQPVQPQTPSRQVHSQPPHYAQDSEFLAPVHHLVQQTAAPSPVRQPSHSLAPPQALQQPVNQHDKLSLDDDLDNLFADTPSTFTPHKVGSDLVIKKPWLPKGIYFIFCMNLIALPASFLNSANTTLVYSALLTISFVLSVIMLFKKEYARKILSLVSILIVIVTISASGFFFIQHRKTDAIFLKNYYEIKSPDAQQMTQQQKYDLANAQAKVIATMDKQVKAKKYFYAFSAFLIVENVFILIYLRRAKVKGYFIPGSHSPVNHTK